MNADLPPESGPDAAPSLQDPLKRLRARIEKEQSASAPPPEQAESAADSSRGNAGIQAGIELIGGIVGGGALGLMLDRWLDTKPIFMILLFFLGTAAGFMAIWKTEQGIGTGVGFSSLHNRKKDAKTPD